MWPAFEDLAISMPTAAGPTFTSTLFAMSAHVALQSVAPFWPLNSTSTCFCIRGLTGAAWLSAPDPAAAVLPASESFAAPLESADKLLGSTPMTGCEIHASYGVGHNFGPNTFTLGDLSSIAKKGQSSIHG